MTKQIIKTSSANQNNKENENEKPWTPSNNDQLANELLELQERLRQTIFSIIVKHPCAPSLCDECCYHCYMFAISFGRIGLNIYIATHFTS